MFSVNKIDAVICFSKIIHGFLLICFKVCISKILDRTDVLVKLYQFILGSTFYLVAVCICILFVI